MKKLIFGIVLTILVTGSIFIAYGASNTNSGDCCEKQAACCYEGSPCCEDNK